MEFSRDDGKVLVNFEKFAVKDKHATKRDNKEKTKKCDVITFTLNGVAFTAKHFSTEEELMHAFSNHVEIFCSKLFEDTAWGDCAESFTYVIKLLPDKLVSIVKI